MSDIAAALPQDHGHDAHSHGHASADPNLKFYFKDKGQQFEASKLGMWLFLATEVLLFGGLFAGFGIMQGRHYEAFKSAHHHLDWRLGALNTVVLLTSSWTMVMAVWTAQTNDSQQSKKAKLLGYLSVTWLCALAFLVVKYFEYAHKYHDGLLLGKYFNPAPGIEALPNEFMFFSFYFMMTGLHGFHVIVGMVLIGILIYRTNKGDFTSSYYTPVDLIGLYWHLVDLIWIYLFPLLYLIS